MKFWYPMAVVSVVLAPALAHAGEGSLRGSPQSMTKQHDVAVDEELTFYRTPDAVRREVEAGTLEPLTGNENYKIANVSFAYAVPEVRMMVERLSAQYRTACGEQLVVTSLTRPTALQPRNAHKLSVHPAGIAVDLRIPFKPTQRSWLEARLLTLENAGVLDVTREKRPPHYHVAVFPERFSEWAKANPVPLDQEELATVVAHLKEISARPLTSVLPPGAVHTADIGGGFAAWAFAALAGIMIAGGTLARRVSAMRARVRVRK